MAQYNVVLVTESHGADGNVQASSDGAPSDQGEASDTPAAASELEDSEARDPDPGDASFSDQS